MKKLLALALCLALVGLNVRAEDKEEKKDKPASIKEVMAAHGKSEESLQRIVTEAVEGKEWASGAKVAKKWELLAADLGKNKPKKGSAASWKKETTSYEKTVKKLAAAMEEKNEKDAKKALGEVGASCKSCHPKHK